MSSGYSFEKGGGEAGEAGENPEQVRTEGPTIEEYVAAGYPALHYPPNGYDAVESPALAPVRAWRADLHNAEKRAAAAAALGVSVGELVHGRLVAPTQPEAPNLTQEQDAAIPNYPGTDVPAYGPGYSAEEVERQRQAPNLTPDEDAELAAQNQALAEAHGITLGGVDLPVATGDAATTAASASTPHPDDVVADRRKNDPSELSAAEREALAETERLAKVEERRRADAAAKPKR